MRHVLWVIAQLQLTAFYCLFMPFALGSSTVTGVTAIQNAIEAGSLQQASTLLESALKATPDDADLLNLRGVVEARRGQIPEARQDFTRAVQQSENLMPAWQNLARACQSVADHDSSAVGCSQRAWQHVVERQPQNQEAIRGMAIAFERSEHYAESLHWLGKAKPDQSALTTDLMIRCLDLAGMKRNSEALGSAKLLGSQTDFGDGDLEAMTAAGPDVTLTLAEALDKRTELKTAGLKQLAIAYETKCRFSDAQRTLERLALLEPDNSRHLLELARVAEKQQQHEAALGYLGHAREIDPSDAQIHYLFGLILAELDLPVEARRSFQRALELSPDNPDYNYAMGLVILSTRDAATAASYFHKFVAARPEDAGGHYALGVADFTSGDYGSAKAELSRLQSNPNVGGGAAFFLGRIARLEGESSSAKQYQLKAMQLMPQFAETHTEMSRLLMSENKLEEAQIEVRRALSLDANSFQANTQLLTLYKKLNDPRAGAQSDVLKKLDEQRSLRAEMMLRGVEIRP